MSLLSFIVLVVVVAFLWMVWRRRVPRADDDEGERRRRRIGPKENARTSAKNLSRNVNADGVATTHPESCGRKRKVTKQREPSGTLGRKHAKLKNTVQK